MPSIVTHPVVPLAMAAAFGSRRVPLRLFLAGAVFAVLPDADVLGFGLGIPYAHPLGHRGFFHSPAFALMAGSVGALASPALRSTYKATFLVLFLSMLSHGILDAATDGGLGIAFLSPFSNQRFFLPWQPIAVSPFGIDRFISLRGLLILRSEFAWVWAPCLSIGLVGWLIRHGMKDGKSIGRHQP